MLLFSLPFSHPQPQSKPFPQSFIIGLNVKQEIPGEGWSIIEPDIISMISVIWLTSSQHAGTYLRGSHAGFWQQVGKGWSPDTEQRRDTLPEETLNEGGHQAHDITIQKKGQKELSG